jgi:ZIP family zinc transporter
MMEAREAPERAPVKRAYDAGRLPAWLLGVVPLLLIGIAVAVFAALGGPGLKGRSGPPVEQLAVERTVLRPGTIELTVRNDGPDPVRIAQVSVNDSFADFQPRDTRAQIDRLGSERLKISYPWLEGESYEVSLVTSTGGTIDHEIANAVETPSADLGFYGLMALLGFYVGVIPITLGMLWLPFVRRVGKRTLRLLIALTIGLLGFLAIDATLEGLDVASGGSQAFGGEALVFLGGLASYLVLTGVSAHMGARRAKASAAGTSAASIALLVAIAIGLHNLGEGLAIGSAYAVGALALGAFLVIGFALHNTTEGLAIVAPVAARPPSFGRLALLGLIAGGPAILGAWIGASAFNSSVAALLLGAGAGAIVQVVQQLVPSIRDRSGVALQPLSVGGILLGVAILYATSLLVSV